MPDAPVRLRRVNVEAIRPLRHEILRAGLPAESAVFPGDDDPATIHIGAFGVTGTCVGCVTLHASTWDGQPAWQLRGMATAESVRGTGIGRRLLEEALALSIAAGPRLLWCNARLAAKGFYEKHGWQTVSDEFDIPTAGPHVRMAWKRFSTADFRPPPLAR